MEFLVVSHQPGSDPERDLQRPDLSEVAANYLKELLRALVNPRANQPDLFSRKRLSSFHILIFSFIAANLREGGLSEH